MLPVFSSEREEGTKIRRHVQMTMVICVPTPSFLKAPCRLGFEEGEG